MCNRDKNYNFHIISLILQPVSAAKKQKSPTDIGFKTGIGFKTDTGFKFFDANITNSKGFII